MDNATFEQNMLELDRQGIRALFDAAGEYHQKHNKGPGGAAVCVCGAACGGSSACRGLAVLRDLFRYMDIDRPTSVWAERFKFIQECFDR
jgi:hypothetical protein